MAAEELKASANTRAVAGMSFSVIGRMINGSMLSPCFCLNFILYTKKDGVMSTLAAEI
jgi:hypothetical protein